MLPKMIKGYSGNDIINMMNNVTSSFYELTKDIENKNASNSESDLMLFNFYKGIIRKENVVGGSIGLSDCNKDRICILVKNSINDPYDILFAYVYDPHSKFISYMNPHWDKLWEKANFGDTFSWRNAKQKKLTINEINHLYVNKVFISTIGGNDEDNYRNAFGNPSI